jgi:transcriptional regulator with XRE-family HTH domain
MTRTATKQRIRRALRAYIKRSGKSLRQVAEEIGDGCQAIEVANYRDGKTEPRAGRMMAIAKLCGITIEELLK